MQLQHGGSSSTLNPVNIANKIDDLRTLNLGATGNPAEVQALVLDGPNAARILPHFGLGLIWLHRLNLN